MSSSLVLKNGTVLIHDGNDHVTPHLRTDILIVNDRIAEIGQNIAPPEDARSIDCTGKIITPGFIDTHHHLWQTQMKGRHADEQLLEYMASGNLQSYNYHPSDSYWGQLSGCLEALDAGTTTVLDHSHGSYTQTHAEKILDATLASGVRCILAYAPVAKLATWSETECTPSQQLTLDWLLPYIEALTAKQPFENRVYIGLGFDFYFLPKDAVISIFTRMRNAGVQLITTHVARNAVFGKASTTNLLNDYGLLDKDIVVSHATGINATEKQILWEKGVYISSTSETECQMGMGWPIALHPKVHGSLGVDCHTNNSSSIVMQARMLLQMGRQETTVTLSADGRFPKRVRGTSEEAFNLATIEGARALGMEGEIGSIEVGKKADLVVWEYEESVGMLGCGDPLVGVLRHSDVRDISMVIVDGRVMKEGGRLCDVQVEGKEMGWKEVAGNVKKSREEVYERMDKCSLEKAREMMVGMFGIDESKLVGVD